MSDLGGESACWAHLSDELDTRDDGEVPTSVDLSRVDDAATGAVWSLPHGGDLDANLVRLGDGDQIDEHVNDDVDVLIVVWDGNGQLTIDDRPTTLRSGVVISIPRGSRRAIRSASGPLSYLSVHRRRGPLTIGPGRPRPDEETGE